jgi:LEA14-like dessication related protein
MKKVLYLILITTLLVSCSLKDVKYTGFDGIEMGKFENKELDFTLKLKVKNDNGFNIKMKPCQLEVLFENHKIADLFLDKKIKFKKKTENTYEAKLTAKMADGALFALTKIRPKNKIDLRFKGTIRASVMGITKKIKVDETQAMDLSLLKHLKLFNFMN